MNIYTKNPTKGELVTEYIKRNHRSSAYSYIRWHARAVVMKSDKQKTCCRCGYNKHTEVCHIKSIQSFNDNSTLEQINHPDNLMLLCPNCHWEYDNGLL
jgi:5-methylcytosine-specific restriction endonuclease McrA